MSKLEKFIGIFQLPPAMVPHIDFVVTPQELDLVVGLDIGTTKICTVVGERVNGDISIIGIGSFPSKGMRRGVVVNIETTVESIRRAVDEASLMARISA